MQVPEYWRSSNNRLYRIERESRPLEGGDGRTYTVRAFSLHDETQPAAEAAVAIRDRDLLEMIRLNQQVPTPEQLYTDAFQAVTAQLDRG